MKKHYWFIICLFTLLLSTTFILKSCKDQSLTSDVDREQNPKTVLLGNSLKIHIGSSVNVSKSAYALGIFELETKQESEDKITIAIKAANSIVNNRRILLDGEKLMLEKEQNKNIYSIKDIQKKSSLTFDYDSNELIYKYKGKKITNAEISENTLSNAQKIIFLKLLIVFQQIMFEDQTVVQPYAKWTEQLVDLKQANIASSGKKAAMTVSSCTRYNISFGMTRAETENKAKEDAKAFLSAYPSCSQIGTPDITCAATISPCVGTVTFQCTGDICDEGIVTE